MMSMIMIHSVRQPVRGEAADRRRGSQAPGQRGQVQHGVRAGAPGHRPGGSLAPRLCRHRHLPPVQVEEVPGRPGEENKQIAFLRDEKENIGRWTEVTLLYQEERVKLNEEIRVDTSITEMRRY